MSGGIAVPLSLSQPVPELAYVLEDSGANTILHTAEFQDISTRAADASRAPTALFALASAREETYDATVAAEIEAAVKEVETTRCSESSGALIIYTSGTTGKPKGALHTFTSLGAQVRSLCTAWEWSKDDVILHGLPLHHIHGIVNALLCPLYMGACIEFLPRFSPTLVWKAWMRDSAAVDTSSQACHRANITVFMGVPTMFVILLRFYDAAEQSMQAQMRRAAARLRLTVSGSAACPVGVMHSWEVISGSRLLERYGMTEIGMALSNPYSDRNARRPGCVGTPLPGVECMIASSSSSSTDDTSVPAASSTDDDAAGVAVSGELLVRGPMLFKEYVGKPKETEDVFDEHGWFKTGDTVRKDLKSGVFTILGRSSTDIIKNGGYKVRCFSRALHSTSVFISPFLMC